MPKEIAQMEGFDPYRKWLGIPAHEQPPNHYRLLGVGLFESDPDVIAGAADRQMSHVRSFLSGQYAGMSQYVLNELAAARMCLLDPQQKRNTTSGCSRPCPWSTRCRSRPAWRRCTRHRCRDMVRECMPIPAAPCACAHAHARA